MSNIFYLMGKSSSGKDTLYRKLMEQNRLLKGIVSYTTRPQRAGETDGKEYFFVTEDEMKAMEQKEIVIEKRVYHTIYGDWSYFTADDGQIQENGCDYLLIGTLESYMKVKKYYGECCYFLYIIIFSQEFCYILRCDTSVNSIVRNIIRIYILCF